MNIKRPLPALLLFLSLFLPATFCAGTEENQTTEEISKDTEVIQIVEQLRKAAEQGDAQSQYYFGILCKFGRGVEKDETEAVSWFLKAAEQGHIEAQYHLGESYLDGEGIEKNEIEAAKWLLKAAEQGHAPSQHRIGAAHYFGKFGIVKDQAKGAEWYRKAAEQNYAYSQLRMGRIFSKGIGMPLDEVRALAWWYLARDNASQLPPGRARDLNEDISALEKKLGTDAVRSAQKQADALKASISRRQSSGGKTR